MQQAMMKIQEEKVQHQIEYFHELIEQMGEPVRVPATGRGVEKLFALMEKSINSRSNVEKAKPLDPESWEAAVLGKTHEVDEYIIGAEYYNGDWEVYGWHPVFSMMQHFRSNDSWAGGYTKNTYRGDHISIPIWSEGGQEVYIYEISFHKGITYADVVGYPDRPREVVEELVTLLQKYETR